MGTKKGGGGKLNRSEILQARLNPKLRLAAEIMGRIQRRTVSSLIEVLVEDAMKKQKISAYRMLQSPKVLPESYKKPQDITLEDIIDEIWSFDEADRFANMAFHLPGLMSPEESRIWHYININPYFWAHHLVKAVTKSGKELPEKSLVPSHNHQALLYERLREQWPLIQSILEGKTDIEELKKLNPPSAKIITIPYEPSQGFEVVDVRDD